jgi:hypothetical protein
MVRANLFAIATTATFLGRRVASWVSHSGGDLLLVSTERAPRISSVRRYLSPRLLIPSNRTRPPVPVCRGTNPSQVANSRPDLKAFASPSVATAAVALSSPTPGISAIRWLAES